MFLISLAIASAQTPTLNYISPGAVPPGKSTSITLTGKNLGAATRIWTSFPADSVRVSETQAVDADQTSFRLTLLRDAPLGIGACQALTPDGLSNLRLVAIDDLPSVQDRGDNKTLTMAQPIAHPIAVDGNCDELGYDYFEITVKKSERLSFEAVAYRLGTALDPVLRVLDASGRELAYCDDFPGLGADARIQFEFAEAGKYFIELRDTQYRGGSQHRYRLRVGNFAMEPLHLLPVREADFEPSGLAHFSHTIEIEPNSTAGTANRIKLPTVIEGHFANPKDKDFYEFEMQKGQRLVLAGRTRSLGSPCDLFMQLFKADQSSVAEANISGANEGTLTNRCDESGTYRLLVEELNQQGGPGLSYRIEAQVQGPGFALSVETDKMDAAAGGSAELKVTCTRFEYDGPITLVLKGVGKNLELSNNVIPAKTNEVQLKLTVPKNASSDQLLHFTIHGYAKIGDAFVETQATTLPALKKLFPAMLYPPVELDGLISFGIKPSAPTRSASTAKTSS